MSRVWAGWCALKRRKIAAHGTTLHCTALPGLRCNPSCQYLPNACSICLVQAVPLPHQHQHPCPSLLRHSRLCCKAQDRCRQASGMPAWPFAWLSALGWVALWGFGLGSAG